MQISKEKAQEILQKCAERVKKIFSDETKTREFVDDLDKKKTGAPLKEALSAIPLLISMIKSYFRKEYTEIPAGTLLAVGGALLYWLSPIDLIPDVVPVIGYVDDAAVVAAALALIRTDLDAYKQWLREQGREA